MAKRKKPPLKPKPLDLIRQLHEQLKQCDRLPPPWDAYQTDDPLRHHNLFKRLEEGLRISSFGPGRQSVLRGEPPRQELFWPDRCWAIQVMPSFHNWGLFAVFESRSLVRCAFVCKGHLPDQPQLDYAVVDCFFGVQEWQDPALVVLNRGEMVPTPDRNHPEGELWATQDGIGYMVRFETSDVRAVLQFANPRSEQYRALERAAYTVAQGVAKSLDHPQVSSFMRVWKGYSRD
jgi:hypothetical protein